MLLHSYHMSVLINDRNDLMSVIEVNTQGPNLVTQAMLPLLQRSQKKLVVNM